MKIKNNFESMSFKKKFALFFVLVAFLPLITTVGMIVLFVQIDKESKRANELKFESQIKYSLVTSIKSVVSDVEFLSQSNAFLDFVMAPDGLRSYTENRLYGQIQQIENVSHLRPSFILFDKDKKKIFESFQNRSFKFGFLENKELTTGFDINSEQDLIFFSKEIKYDDQQFQGPTAKTKGYLVAVVTLSEIKRNIPGLLNIVRLGERSDLSDIELKIDISKSEKSLSLVYYVVFSVVLLTMGIMLGLYFVNKSILIPVARITKSVLDESGNSDITSSENEIEILNGALALYRENIKRAQILMAEQSKTAALVSVASQVAHDIRSPLTALNMVLGTIDKMPEDKRLVVRSAIQRINDIANSLLTKGREKSEKTNASGTDLTAEGEKILPPSQVMLSTLVDTLVSEKRIQYRDKIGIQIDVDLSKSYGLFVVISSTELTRVLSNLINNSVEALPQEAGRILVTLDEFQNKVRLQVKDNGKGIPPEILQKLGGEGFSFGKEAAFASGFGLGLSHAHSALKVAGGSLQILSSTSIQQNSKESPEQLGTTVTILLPKSQPPSWFVGRLEVPAGTQIVALDDDQSIHNVWRGRLSSLESRSHKHVDLLSFTSAETFSKWYQESSKSRNTETIFLVDYELLGQKYSGIEVIERLGIQSRSILVTSRNEEKNVIESCQRLGIKMIPKAMAALIPIEIVERQEQTLYDAIVVDDDELVHMTWKMLSQEKNKSVLLLKKPKELKIQLAFINKKTPLFIDSQLADGVRGEQVAKEFYDLGFKTIYLSTGRDPAEFASMDWIKAIVGKDPIL